MTRFSMEYASALYSLARDEGIETELAAQLDEVCELLGAQKDYLKLLDARSLDAEERKEELAGCFALYPQASVKGRRVLLCDDIFTTGSTMCEAAQLLLQAGAKRVGALAFCASKDNWD